MIGRLSGILIDKSPPYLLIDINGLGYEVSAPMGTCYDLPNPGQPVKLYTHFVVREDAQQLYGFLHTSDRDLFRVLIKISGIGPKVALAILSSLSTQRFLTAIESEDVTQLTRIPGIGKKTAERLVLELSHFAQQAQTHDSSHPTHELPDSQSEAISALCALGYKPQDAKRAIEKIYHPKDSAETLIKMALQHMNPTRSS